MFNANICVAVIRRLVTNEFNFFRNVLSKDYDSLEKIFYVLKRIYYRIKKRYVFENFTSRVVKIMNNRLCDLQPELVEFFYLWKKSPEANYFKPHRRRRQGASRRNRNMRNTRAGAQKEEVAGE